jgi:hypothetical protein
MIYQHEAHGADQLIAIAIDAHIQASKARTWRRERLSRDLGPSPLVARKINNCYLGRGRAKPAMTWAYALGAGDGNRTRTISLGICPVRACHMA